MIPPFWLTVLYGICFMGSVKYNIERLYYVWLKVHMVRVLEVCSTLLVGSFCSTWCCFSSGCRWSSFLRRFSLTTPESTTPSAFSTSSTPGSVHRGLCDLDFLYWAWMSHCFWSDPVALTAADCVWPITGTDSVLWALEDHAILQSLWNTTIAPPWQFRL